MKLKQSSKQPGFLSTTFPVKCKLIQLPVVIAINPINAVLLLPAPSQQNSTLRRGSAPAIESNWCRLG